MNIAIVGGRDFNNYDILKNTLQNFIESGNLPSAIVSGGAKGADSLAEKFASEFNLEMIVFQPDYKRFGRGATSIRNTQIIENSDIVFAFWDGKSKGTLDSINKSKKMEKLLFIVNY